jgi:hypothetical protein
MCTAKPCVHEAACFALAPEAIKTVYDRCDRSYLAAQHDVRGTQKSSASIGSLSGVQRVASF